MATMRSNRSVSQAPEASFSLISEYAEWGLWPSNSEESQPLDAAVEEMPPLSPSTREAMAEYFGGEEAAGEARVDVEMDSGRVEKASSRTSEETAFTSAENVTHIEENLIWRMTRDYLRSLQVLCSQPDCPPISDLSTRLLQRFSTTDPQSVHKLSFVLRALDIAKESPVIDSDLQVQPAVSLSQSHKRHLTSKRFKGTASVDHVILRKVKNDASCSSGTQSKTGRKPEKYCCFMCHSVFPYKKILIRHIQQDHGIARCQSLLYKRLNQGEQQFKRLYAEEEGRTAGEEQEI